MLTFNILVYFIYTGNCTVELDIIKSKNEKKNVKNKNNTFFKS